MVNKPFQQYQTDGADGADGADGVAECSSSTYMYNLDSSAIHVMYELSHLPRAIKFKHVIMQVSHTLELLVEC